MLTYAVAFLLSLVVCFALTPLFRDFAMRLGLVDAPSEDRKIHEHPIPRIGGVAIALSFFVPVVGLFFWDNKISHAYLEDPRQVAGLVGGSLFVLAFGLYDDVKGLRPVQKLALQLVVSVAVYFVGYRVLAIGNPFGDPVQLGLLSFPVTILWMVGIMNAINLIDGLDGLATGISLFSVLTLFILGVINENIIVSLTAIALAGSLTGFLRYNFNPASIFMGDSGSLFLGFILALTGISGAAKSSTVVSLLIPVLALGLPVMETLLTLARRFLGGRPLFSADREHFHHKLLDLGFSQRQVTLLMYLVCIVLGFGALSLVFANSVQSATILGAFTLATLVFSRMLGYLTWDHVSQSVRYGLKRQQRLRSYLEEASAVGARVRRSETIQDAVEEAVSVGAGVQADGARCAIAVLGRSGLRRYSSEWPGDTPEQATSSMGYRLDYSLDWALGDIEITGFLSLWWHCEDDYLQVPEASIYDWLALVLRDRVLQLTIEGDSVKLLPLTSGGGDV